MQHRVAAFSFAIALIGCAGAAHAAELPEIRSSGKNATPECATPGRMMAMIRARNGDLDRRFASIATEYMRHGEQLGVRWDYAFFQMILETGALSFKNGNRNGEVRPEQNNFAGLGATGKGEHGESFPDVATGVRAHLEHLLLYAGAPVESPVAERTRKVHEWGVLTSWQKGFKRPITYSDLARKWAPHSGAYSSYLQAIADKFYAETCRGGDPNPELVAEARGQKARAADAGPSTAKPDRVSGAELAKAAVETGKTEANDVRSGLGAAGLAKSGVKIINGSADDSAALADDKAAEPSARKDTATPRPDAKGQTTTTSPSSRTRGNAAPLHTASAAAAAKPLPQAAAPAPAPGEKCRVWTASYGGQKAIIIRALVDRIVNYTVLDVNEGSEGREAEAFISAYAKGGSIAGEFASQNQALDRAFELCPEG